MKNILIVEDDKALAEGIVLVLRQDGFSFQCCHNVKDAKKVLEKNIFDLILLDINLPDGSGLDICRGLRKEERLDPVIFLTALDTELHEVTGFQAGADDYITKPFSVPLLVRRIQAVLNRSLCRDGRFYYNGDLCYDFDGKELKIGEKSIPLTPTEMRLLEVFLHNRRRVLTREMLLARVWDAQENYVDDKALAVNIRRLREKIEKEPGKPERIKTVFGIGYKWEEE